MTSRSRQIVTIVGSLILVAFVTWLLFIAFDESAVDNRMSTLNPLSWQAQRITMYMSSSGGCLGPYSLQ